MASLGDDLGHGQALGIPPAVDEPPEEGLAHLPAAQQRQCRHRPEGSGFHLSPNASGPEEPLETDPHFPERTGPACTSGLTHLTATRRLRRCAP